MKCCRVEPLLVQGKPYVNRVGKIKAKLSRYLTTAPYFSKRACAIRYQLSKVCRTGGKVMLLLTSQELCLTYGDRCMIRPVSGSIADYMALRHIAVPAFDLSGHADRCNLDHLR